jgi:putative ABC transport system permease protein
MAYYVANGWLNEFAYKTETSIIIFILSGLVALTFALISSGYQAYKAANVHPIKNLKCE